MVNFINDTGSKTDLVTVGGISCGCGGNYLTLRKLTCEGFFDRLKRICRTGKAHCTVYVRTTGEGVSDRAADTGSRTAEGLDLGGMVMCFVLEEEEPGLALSVCLYLDLYGTSVDLLRLIKLIKFAHLAKALSSEGTDVHKVLRLGPSDRLSCSEVIVVGLFKKLVLELY